jgi:hypothetical protein
MRGEQYCSLDARRHYTQPFIIMIHPAEETLTDQELGVWT